MAILAAGLTNIGQKRKSNQDSIYLNCEQHLFVVADGMGGHQGGDIASQMAVKAIPEYLIPKLMARPSSEDLVNLLKNSVLKANEAILQKSRQDSKLQGMGTTVVALLFSDSTLYIANVGDSRAYLLHKGEIYQLSKDHSLIQEKINLGIYTRQQAQADKMKNVLSRTVGFDDSVDVDIFNFKVHKGDLFFICSDGLHGKVSDHDMMHILNRHINPSQQQITQKQLNDAANELVAQANANGGQDNISVIIAYAQ